MSDTQTAAEWPSVTRLREDFAEQAQQVADAIAASGQSERDEETVLRVKACAIIAADRVVVALVVAAEMGLDVWMFTR